jgi:hypothetical protein
VRGGSSRFAGIPGSVEANLNARPSIWRNRRHDAYAIPSKKKRLRATTGALASHVLPPHRTCDNISETDRSGTGTTNAWWGPLARVVLETLETIWRLHGYRRARGVEPTSGELLSVNGGTLEAVLLILEQEGQEKH